MKFAVLEGYRRNAAFDYEVLDHHVFAAQAYLSQLSAYRIGVRLWRSLPEPGRMKLPRINPRPQLRLSSP
jgi:hypothetical protein